MNRARDSCNKKKDIIAEWLTNITTLKAITEDDFNASEPGLLAEFKNLYGKDVNWEFFFCYILNLKLDPQTDKCLKHLHKQWSIWKSSKDHKASHQAKRRMVNMLGINNPSYTIADAIRQEKDSIIMPCGTTLKLVGHNLDTSPLFPIRHHMFDLPNTGEGLEHCYDPETVNEANGFYIVQPGESVLFYSSAPEDFTENAIEMVIIHGVALPKQQGGSGESQTSDGEKFYNWLKTVIDYACTVWKNQHEKNPCSRCYGHDGHMAQFGLTLGA
ncbi:hypothetical protein Moror_5861 [Moniliophthora roreri MCA 2997]|uniref:Uncharacterized protein n=1 Tax=Moniliophthora roreri (strain MCA 2997) TaxID=1381753 RepID=V2X427_MONRO|nr:hypothetical protein Moror_5861 [Moniliophthora roreri MCA 2997]